MDTPIISSHNRQCGERHLASDLHLTWRTEIPRVQWVSLRTRLMPRITHGEENIFIHLPPLILLEDVLQSVLTMLIVQTSRSSRTLPYLVSCGTVLQLPRIVHLRISKRVQLSLERPMGKQTRSMSGRKSYCQRVR